MLKVGHPINYPKKEKVSSEILKEIQYVNQLNSQIRSKRSDDNLKLPENFRIGQAIADGNCFFDSFRQGLEQQLGIEVTVEQLRQYCKEFAQNNPSEWFINAIANSHDNNGVVRKETPDSYIVNILSNNRWGDSEVEGRILCEKYRVKLHIVEKHAVEGKEVLLDQIVSSEGSRSVDSINYNEENTIHIINRGSAHFEPILSTQEIQHNKRQSPDPSDYDDEITPEVELINIIKRRDSEEEKLTKIRKLFEKEPKPDINFQDKDNDTPLHIAVRKKELKVIEWLVKNGAKIDIKNGRSRTSLDIAKRLKRQDIVQILESHIQPSLKASVGDNQQIGSSVQQRSNLLEQVIRPKIPIHKVQKSDKVDDRDIKRPGKQGLHGEIYQLKLLMLFLKRGVDNQYSFRLSTEKKEAKKFDDLFFEITRDGKKEYRLLQAKHKDDESKKITFDNLLTESDSDYSLVKYFFSYQDSKKEKLFKNGMIKDVTVCTNINLDLGDKYELNGVSRTIREVVQKIEEKDNILDVDSETFAKEAVRYRFSDNVVLLLKPKLEDYNLTRLARRLAECFLKNNSIQHHQEHDIFKIYHTVLAKEVIDVKAKKFHDKFIKNEGISEDTQKFREAFAEEIKKQSKEVLTLEDINLAISDKRKVVDNKSVVLQLSKNFGNGEDKSWPNNAISDEDVKDFLDHLVFAVNQPNEEQLGKIIENDISKEFNFAARDYVYNELFVEMISWLNGKGEEFISYQDGNSFFDGVKQKLSELELTGLTLEYKSKVEKFGIKFNSDAVQEIGLDEFLSAKDSNKQVFNAITQQNTLSAIKVYQVLQNIYEQNYIFMQLNSILHLRDRVIQAFKGSSNLLIIECKTKEKEEDIQILYDQLSSIIKSSSNKKVVLITQGNDLLANKFKSALRNKYQEKIDERNSLTDLTNDSQQKLLKEGKVIFQGKQLNIKQLLGFDDKELVPQNVLGKLNLGVQELETLLDSQSVGVWDQSLQLSSLESAYYKTHTRISLDQLKQALIVANPEDKFVFVGEENEIKQLLPKDQKDTLKGFLSIEAPPYNYRFIFLDAGQEEKQFKQLCQQIDKANVKKKNDELQPVLHLLKKEGEEWIWKQTYTRDFYIKRSFYPIVVGNDNIKDLVVKQDPHDFIVFSGVDEKELFKLVKIGENEKDDFKKNTVVFLDKTAAQEEFKRLSDNPTNKGESIHWVQVNEVESQKQLWWRNSCGEISRLREKLDKKEVNYSIDEASLADNEERVIILSDEPGMGKSTTLARVAELIQKEKPLSWIMKVDLNRHQQLLSSKLVKTKEEVVDLLFDVDPTLKKNPLAKRILAYKLECPGQVVLLWDGFDEVKTGKQEAVLTLFKFLKKETSATIWVTTRKHDQKKLEDSLSVLAYLFEPLNEAKQIDFLSKFWITTLKLEEKNLNKLILEGYAKEVIQRFEQSIQAYQGNKNFISIPLRARMLAETFQEDVKKAVAENKDSSELFKEDEKFVISNLYQQFIDRKYGIYLCEKAVVDKGLDKESQAALRKDYTKTYERLAMKVLFDDDGKVVHLISDKKEKFSLNTLSRIGLISGNEEPVNFIHRTFAEYFAAKWLIKHIENSEVKKFLGTQLFKKESSVVRHFFDNFLIQGLPLHSSVLRNDISAFEDLRSKNLDTDATDSLGRTVLHIAAQEGRHEVIQYLWSDNKLAVDQFGKTPLHYAASFGHDKVVEQLLRDLIDIDLDDHIFRTPLHFDTEIGEGNSLFINNLEYTKSNLVKLVNKLDKSGNPSLYYAVDNEHWDAACNLLLHGADSSIITKESKKKLLLFAADKTHGAYANQYHRLRPIVGLLSIQVPETVQGFSDNYEYPRLLSYFFACGHTKVIDALLGSIQDFSRRKRIANHGDNGITPLYRITENYDLNDADHLKIIRYLFNQGVHHGIEIYSNTKGILLLVAATKGNLNTFKYLVEQKEVPVDCSVNRHTAVDRALIENNQLMILKYLWENYRESINDSLNRTPLHIAAFSANLQAIHYLCTHDAEINAKDRSGKTPLHYAVQVPRVYLSPVRVAELIGHQKIVQYLIEEQEANLSLVDRDGKTALDLAIENQQWAITDYLIKKNAQARRSSLLTNIKKFFKSPSQDTFALHLAISNGDIQWFRFLLEQQIDVNRLDQKGRTPLHLTAAVNSLDKTEMVERLLQRGAQYDVRDDNQKTALDLLKENNFSPKGIWLLQLIEELFHSQDLMQNLQKKLLREMNEQTLGPYGTWHPDVYDRDNPMQFVLNARSVKKGTLLHVAADTGNLEALKCLLKFNREYLQLKFDPQYSYKGYQAMDINAKDEQGNMPLHRAAQQGNQEILLLLLQEGAIFNAKNSQKRTPKILAKKKKHQGVVQILQRIEDLFEAVKQGTKLGIIDDTLQKVSVYAKDRDGKTLLHLVAQQGQIEMIKILLDCIDPLKQEVVINALDNQHSTPLHEASTNGQVGVIRLLLQQGARFNIKDKQGKTPLDHLQNQDDSLLKSVDKLFNDIQSNRPGTVIEVLQCFDASHDDLNAIVQAKDERGYSLLHWAAKEHYSDVLQQLLMRGAIYNTKDNSFKANGLFQLIKEWMYDEKPLKFSVEEVAKDPDKLTIVKKAQGPDGKTPLHTNTNYFRLKYLIAQGIDLTLRDQEGNTPLHAAVKRGDIAIAKLFLDQGVDVNAKDKDGSTPLHLAAKGGYQEVLQLLLNKQADPNIQDKSGKTPLDLAKEKLEQNSGNDAFKTITNLLLNSKDKSQNQEEQRAISLEECLPSTSSGRSKREAKIGECEFSWEDVDEFNTEKDENRDFSKIKIDGEKFVDYVKDLPEEKRSQLIQLADKVKVTGESQSLVNKLISNQKVINHLNRVGKISGMTMHGMMAKNVLSDFLNRDYQGVAINVGFIAGGQGFAKVAEAASFKGLKLASEGKLLLGRSLRAASPFLARGTSAFVVYDLVNQVKAFKNGTEEALVGVVGDSIYLGVDAAEIGIEIAEAFEVLEGVSSVTGPIGAAVGAVVFVGTDVYMAVKRVDKIDEIIHLTGKERFVEGLRAFIGMQPENHIQELLQEKQVSNQLVRQGLEYLKQHGDIQSYVFPTGKSVVDSCRKVPYKTSVCDSGGLGGRCLKTRTVTRYAEECTTKFEVDLDNTVQLDRKRTDIKWSRAKPDNPSGGELFCLPRGNHERVPSYGSYLCENAIGITDLSAKTGNHTLINLGEGTDHAKGFIDSPNIFVVNNGSKRYFGGNKDDIFILQGSSITGYFYGEGGVNTLDLTSFAPEEGSIDVKLHIGQVEDYYRKNFFGMSGINKFLGRKAKADQVFITCDSDTSDIKFVDGQSGSEEFVDHINIHDKDCAYEMQVVVRPNTVIYNRALKGDFHYIVPYALGSAKVDFIYTAEALNLNNTFAFEYEPAQIKNVDVRNINVLNKTSHIITFNFSPMSDKEFNITISGASNPSYRLGNNTEIKVGNRGNLYMLENTNKSVNEIIKDYLVVANRLNRMSFFIQSLLSDETVAIGSGNYEVIHNNPLQKSHLVGNGGENVYVIDSKRFEIPLPEVVIYDLDVESSVDTIDLRNLVQQARGKFSNSFKLQVLKSANDLLLKATVEKSTGDSSISEKHEYFTVRLKDGVNWYNKTHVIMDNVPMRISLDNNEWSLKPQPLIFEKDKEVIVVTSQDVEENTELITPKKAGNYTFVRDHGSDLIITNAFNTQDDLCTIVLSKFYETPKMETLSIKFADKEIVLKDKQKEINTARYVDIVKREHKEQVYSDVFNRSPEVMLSDQPHRHQVRHRRSTSGSARPSSWINRLFGWIKGSVGGLFYSRAALSEEASNTASSIPQVDEQFAKASVSSSSLTSTTLPSDGTDKKQENGGFFRDNIDYVNANIKQMRERQTPVKFKPSGGNTILEMGDHYLSQVDFNGTIMLLDLLIKKVTGQKYISTVDQSISPLEAQGYALNITNRFEKVLNKTAIKSGISVTNLNFDPVVVQSAIIGKIINGKFSEIAKILYSFAKEACPEFKQTDKFLDHLRSNLKEEKETVLLQQKVEKPSKDLSQEVSRKVELSKKPDTFLNETSVVKGISRAIS